MQREEVIKNLKQIQKLIKEDDKKAILNWFQKRKGGK